jgi:5-methyltetrahydropteroyltriglutamate--homocysteine methyltransferase
MGIPTEPIGSIPRPTHLLEATGSPVITDGEHLGPEGVGTTDDCGFSPFGDDLSTARETAFAKIAARVQGTRLAAEHLGWS